MFGRTFNYTEPRPVTPGFPVDPSSVQVTAVTTIVSAQTEDDAKRITESLRELSRLGLPIYATERGSPPDLLAHWTTPNLQLRTHGTSLVQQVKDSFHRAHAAGHRYVLYTEPDKCEFFAESAHNLLNAPEPAPSAAIVAARDDESFRTFPSGQQAVEHVFNLLSSTIAALHGDILYGPIAIDLEHAMPFLENVPDDLGWGWRPYVLARLKLAGLHVVPYEGHFPCPEDQREEDEPHHRVHRLVQLEQNVRGLRLALTHAHAE